ncbi:MAG: thioredoxin family protein [Erysipelotrichaceae bacterium]|nr:thioredoxin family protein [Erysipelotrichaceae bacterium]
MDKLIKITNVDDYNKAILGKTIIVFSTTWCPDCHFLKTFIGEIVDENKDWTFYYIDRDELVDLCIDLEILGIPSLIAYKNGQEVSRLVNKLRKTKAEVQAFIDGIE